MVALSPSLSGCTLSSGVTQPALSLKSTACEGHSRCDLLELGTRHDSDRSYIAGADIHLPTLADEDQCIEVHVVCIDGFSSLGGNLDTSHILLKDSCAGFASNSLSASAICISDLKNLSASGSSTP